MNINKSQNSLKEMGEKMRRVWDLFLWDQTILVVTAAPMTVVFVRLLDVGICSSCDEVSDLRMDRLGEDR